MSHSKIEVRDFIEGTVSKTDVLFNVGQYAP